MQEVRFGDFWNNPDAGEPGARFYALYDGPQCLYVGISRRWIWERWFDSTWGHIRGRTSCLNSRVGQHVVDHLPASLEWMITLWTEKDVVLSFGEARNLGRHPGIEDLERLLIRHLKPSFNVTHNANSNFYGDDQGSAAETYDHMGE